MVDVSGNVMSLLAPEFKDLKDLSTIRSGNAGTYEFYYLFYNCKNIKTCKDLALPATILADHCYDSMFYGCTSLTTAPELPAQTLANSCYSNMFEDCTSLAIAPVLPATTLATDCYSYMFYGCTSLTSAKTIFNSSYDNCHNMFVRCKNLTTIDASEFGPSGQNGMTVDEVLANFASLNIPKTEHGVMVICIDGSVTVRQGSGSSSSS